MTIDVYSATGTKKTTWELPVELFEARVNKGLIHQAVTMQQSNRRNAIAHAKSRGEVEGSTHKLYGQKHTGRARRGSSRSPLLKGGGKAFGPKRDRNFRKDMPKSMRHAALAACLSFQAKNKAIIGLEGFDAFKTKEFVTLMQKLPVELGRRIILVVPEAHAALHRASGNVPNVKVLLASYLNPEDVVGARTLIFLTGAIDKAVQIFGKHERIRISGKREPAETEVKKEVVAKKEKPAKKAAVKKAAPKKTTKKSSSPKA